MPTNVYGLPQGILSEAERKDILETSAGKILKNGQDLMNKSKADLVVRDLQPEEDLGQTDNIWDFTVNSATQFDEVLSKEVDDGKFIVISAIEVLDANPDTSFVRFSSGATTIQEVGLESAYSQDNPVIYMKSPVIFDENSTLKVDLYSESTGTKNIVLHGYVAETEGDNISPGDAS